MSALMKFSTFSAIVVLLYASAVPAAHGTFAIRGATVSGRICCTVNGNCAAGSTGVVGVPVSLNCPTNILAPFTLTVVATTTTGANGNFVFTLPPSPQIFLPFCTVTFTTPVPATTNCTVLATAAARTFTARILVTSLGSILSNALATAITLTFN